MSPNDRARRLVLGIAAVLSLGLLTPTAGNAEEQAVAAAPASGLSGNAPSGDSGVAARRAAIARSALQSGDLGSGQEEALTAVVAAFDNANGDAAVAADRAAREEKFRAVELSLSSSLGARQQASLACGDGS